MVRQRKRDEVLASARRLFLERGFAGASVDDIAAGANVSKATVYSNFRDKDDLLLALIEQVSDAAGEIVARTLSPLDEAGDLEPRLRRVGSALVAGVLQAPVLQLRRLAIAEGARAPEVARAYWERAPGLSLARLEAAFRRLIEIGELDGSGDPRTAAEHFAYALVGPLQDRALLAPEAEAPDVEAHVSAVVKRFLAAWTSSAASRAG